MGSRWYAVVVDATDPARLSRWWAEVLGYRVIDENANEVMVGSGEPASPVLYFVRAAEAKAGKNRLHIDLTPDDRNAEVERLLDMGARHVDIGQGEPSWVVLADPEGNEFCVLRARLTTPIQQP
jgi:catechol 2,3-dioxygenase-like lactoylglutathione lyase family enzyme